MRRAEVNDVIQVNKQVPNWCGCLMIVREVKSWGVTAGMRVPCEGSTFLRLNDDQFEVIGKAVLVPEREEDEE